MTVTYDCDNLGELVMVNGNVGDVKETVNLRDENARLVSSVSADVLPPLDVVTGEQPSLSLEEMEKAWGEVAQTDVDCKTRRTVSSR